MSVSCPKGFSPDPTRSIISKPDDSCTLNNDDQTYVRLKYEFRRVAGLPDVAIGCGTSGTFSLNYSKNAEGEITASAEIVEEGVKAGKKVQVGVWVKVDATKYEYVGIPIVLVEIREEGTFERSGGFNDGGFWNTVKLAWNVLRHGGAALVPTMEYNDPDTVTERILTYSWLICRKPCKKP